MISHPKPPKDRRIRQIRKKLRSIGRDLALLRLFLRDRVPHQYQQEMKRELQRAFNAGRAFSEVQHLPQKLPVNDKGMLQIGPSLRFHINQTRKIYADIDQLRDIVEDIFDEKSNDLLRNIFYENEDRVSGTDIADIKL